MTNLDRMQTVDAAWNERRWDDYAALFHPDFQAYTNDSPTPHDLPEHLERALKFCAAFPDGEVHEPYITTFESADGSRTCTVSRVTGKPAGAAAGFDITMAIIALWEAGQMIEQRQFLDESRMASQLAALR